MNSIAAESRGNPQSLFSQGLIDLVDLGDLLSLCLPVQDVFRSISARVCSLLDCGGTRLYLLQRDRKSLYVAAVWKESDLIEREDMGIVASELARLCLSSKRIVMNSLEAVGYAGCGVLLPLFRGSEVVGVLELRFPIRPASVDQLEKDCMIISEVVSPVVVNSLIFERNRAAAFTDLTTELPNRRAFETALEDFIAASQNVYCRVEGAVIAIEIAGLFGVGVHASDAVLCQLANILRRSLRDMDFLARSRSDEFLLLLPEVTEYETLNVIARIEHEVQQERWEDPCPIRVKLNFGWSVVGKDGATVTSLLASARVRMNLSKTDPRDRKVLLFPRA